MSHSFLWSPSNGVAGLGASGVPDDKPLIWLETGRECPRSASANPTPVSGIRTPLGPASPGPAADGIRQAPGLPSAGPSNDPSGSSEPLGQLRPDPPCLRLLETRSSVMDSKGSPLAGRGQSPRLARCMSGRDVIRPFDPSTREMESRGSALAKSGGRAGRSAADADARDGRARPPDPSSPGCGGLARVSRAALHRGHAILASPVCDVSGRDTGVPHGNNRRPRGPAATLRRGPGQGCRRPLPPSPANPRGSQSLVHGLLHGIGRRTRPDASAQTVILPRPGAERRRPRRAALRGRRAGLGQAASFHERARCRGRRPGRGAARLPRPGFAQRMVEGGRHPGIEDAAGTAP